MANISKNNIFTNLDYDTSARVFITYLLGCGSSIGGKAVTRSLLRNIYKQCGVALDTVKGVQILRDSDLAPIVAIVYRGSQLDVLLFTNSILPWTVPDYRKIVEARRTVVLPDDVISEMMVLESKKCIDYADILQIVSTEVLPNVNLVNSATLEHCLLLDITLDGGAMPKQYNHLDMVALRRALRWYDNYILSSHRSTYVVRRGQLVHRQK